MRTVVVAVTALGLSLSAFSIPSAQASDTSAPAVAVEDQRADLPTDALPPLCVVRDIDEEPSPSVSPSVSASPSMSASPSVSPSVSPSASLSPSSSESSSPSATSTASPSVSDEQTVTPSPTVSDSLSPRLIRINDDSLVTESPAATPNEDVVEESAEETSDEAADEVSEDESVEESVEESAEPTPEVSAPSSECPVAATGLSAEAGNNEVTLSWSSGEVPEDDDRFTDPVAFYVSVSGPESKVLRTTETTLTVLGLRNGVEYSFEVFAATQAGRSAPAGPVSATPTTGMEGVVAGLIVEFADGVEPPAGATDVPGQDRVAEVDLVVAERVADDAVLVELSEPVDLATAEKIAADLSADEQVEWAEPDQFFFTSSEDLAQTVSVPTDSQYASSQWNLWDSFGISVGDGSSEMTDAWAGPRGDGVTVAVIDTGITSHPELDPQLVAGYDFVSNPEQLASSRQANAPPVAFDGDYIDAATYGSLGRDANPADPGDWRGVAPVRDSSWHGTKIAGLIAATSNADGITGIAPEAKIQPIRALSWRGGLLSDIAASITWASGGTIDGVPANTNPSKVINMSFAVETMCPVALQQAIDGALARGSILVAAAGNASDDAAKYAPGNCNGVITVAATNRDGNRADYSNYGATIDIAAPGGDSANPITTTANNGTQTPGQPATATDSGTSIAAAHVSAAAAILLSRNASITPSDAYTKLTGSDFTKAFNNQICDTFNPDYGCGTGILSLAQVASGTCTPTERVVGAFVFIAFTSPDGLTCTTDWTPPAASVRVDYLVVGGGGGGGAGRGGGGGAGGFIGSTTPIDIAGPTTVQVGGGGVGGSNTPNNGTSGADSKLGTFAGAVAKGGGYGAGWNSGIGGVGGDGGSGGGASGSGYGPFGSDPGATATSRNGGSGESGQGSSGGSNAPQGQCPGWGDTGSYFCTGGGGGGAESAGTSGSTYVVGSDEYRKAGNGGAGKPAPTWLTASARTALGIPSFYAGGGGGAGQYASRTPGGDGGTGGGGDGCGSGVCNGEPGTANTGGGGGGSEGGGSEAGDGGSGIVVIRYASSCSASAPTTSGVYTVVSFTTAGSCTWTAPAQVRSIDVLAVGGGGGGGAWVGAGGGGGEVTESSGLGVTPGNSYTVTVGAGGWGAEMRPGFSADADAFVRGSNGRNSSFGSVTALGGGVGGSANLQAPGSGDTTVATGGGAPYADVNPGVGKVSSGGVAGTSSQPHPTGGGGGAQSGGGGGQSVSPFTSGAGGAGKVSTITGVTYGGGGGGSAHGTWPTGTTLTTPTNEPGAGGDGGGGAGGRVTTATLGTVVQGVAGTDGLGGGGGGGANLWISGTTYGSIGGDGGDGTVIIRYFTNALATNAGGGVQPGNYTIGSGWVTAPKVQLVTAAGATVTTENVSITATFTASSGSATLASATAVTDVNGVADFSGMTVSGAAGTSGTLTFTATGYGPVTSTSFSIVRAAQDALSVTSTSGTYGTALSLTTSGGSGSGAVSYAAVDGTALGCTVSGSSLTVTQAGTCLVTATKAEDASYSATSSPQTTVTFAKAQQAALSIDGPYSLEYGETFPLTTTGGSGAGAVSYSRNGTTGGATCTVTNAGSSSTVKGTKAGGTCLVGATKAGDVNYDPVLVEQAFTITTRAVTVTASSPSVTYATPIIQSYSVTSGTLATGDAISSITYTYQGTGSTTYGPSTTAPTGTGTYSVTPSAATFSAGLASNYVIQYQPGTVTISQAPQATLSMSSPSTAIYGQTITLAAVGGSGTGALSFSVTSPIGPGLCSLSGSTLTLGDAGSLCKVQATKAASANYTAVTSSEQTITITQAGQTVAFTSDVPRTPERFDTYTPTASALSTVTGSSSGVTPSFVVSGNCTIDNVTDEVTFGLPGTCTITASAASNTNFTAAANLTQVIEIGMTNQTIDFTQPSNVAYGSASVAMSATTSSNGDVTFALGGGTTNSACSVSSLGAVTILAVGTCEVVASAAAFDQYAAASDVTRAFQVVAALPTAPTLTSASAGSQSMTVGFTAPGFTGGVPITGYQLVATPTGGGTTVTSTACTTSPCTITGLANGTAYTVTVAAINSAGTGPASSASTSLTAATQAYAVGSLTATPGDGTVALSWTQPTDLGGGTFVRYELYSRVAGGSYGSAITIGAIGTTSYTFSGLNNGTSYDFKIVTITLANGVEIAGGPSEVAEYAATVPTAPLTPTVLASVATDVQFSWAAPLSDGGAALGSPYYRVDVSTSTPGASAVTCTPSGTDTYCTAAGLTNDAVYTFTVEAHNRIGYSAAASVTYAVPSRIVTLSDLEVSGSAGAVSLTPAFASGTTMYTATVPNSVATVTVTPTTTSGAATVTVGGVAVVSGSASSPISLSVGTNSIAVVVTASDPRFSQTYTVMITRAAAPGGGGGTSGPADRARVPVNPPAEVVSGSRPGAVLLDGQMDSSAVFAANGTNSGWSVVDNAFALSARTESATGAPMPMTPQGVMQVPQGGLVILAGSQFLPGTDLNVFAIPIDQTVAMSSMRGVGRITPRSTPNAVYLGSASVTSTGAVAGSLTVPFTMSVGSYVLQVNGVVDDDQVASVNMLLDVVPGSVALRSAMIREAAFYQGSSAKFTASGKAKLRSMVAAIPANAQSLEIVVVGVSVSLETPRANLRLARDRAENVVAFLKKSGVEGRVTVSLTTSFDLQSSVRSKELPTIEQPMVSGQGKPLTTLSIEYETPGI